MSEDIIKYKNPIPSLDDEPQSTKVALVFNFERPVTRAEAATYITEYIKDGKLLNTTGMHLVGDVTMRYAVPQNN